MLIIVNLFKLFNGVLEVVNDISTVPLGLILFNGLFWDGLQPFLLSLMVPCSAGKVI